MYNSYNFIQKKAVLPPLLKRYRIIVATMTIFFSLIASTPLPFGFSAKNLLLSPHFGIHTFLQMFSSAFVIPYSEFSLSLLFDLGFLHFLLMPIFFFVYTFLSRKFFLRFLSIQAVVGTAFFILFSSFFSETRSISLFNGISFSFVIFWLLLHPKGKTSSFIMIPLSRSWMFLLSVGFCLFFPVEQQNFAYLAQLVAMGISAYLYAVTGCRLRSYIPFLSPFENFLLESKQGCIRFFEWRVARIFRKIKNKSL